MELLLSLWNVVVAVGALLLILADALLPWLPLIAWIAFWLLAVNWRQLYPILMRGGLVGVALIMLMAILVWSSVSSAQQHQLFGLHVDNIVGKTVYVTGLAVIAMLCGSFQLSGGCGRWCRFEEPAQIVDDVHAHH